MTPWRSQSIPLTRLWKAREEQSRSAVCDCEPQEAQGTEILNNTAKELLPDPSSKVERVEKTNYSQMMSFKKLSNQVYGEGDFDKDSWLRICQSYQGPDRYLLVTRSDAPTMPEAISVLLGSITLPNCAFCPEGKVYSTFSGCQWDDIFLSENATLTKSDGKILKTSELLLLRPRKEQLAF